MNPRDRIAPHLRPQIELRRKRLFENAGDILTGARVLEVAPNHCLFTEELLRLGAAHVTLVEFDQAQGEVIRDFYRGNSQVTVAIEDIHLHLFHSDAPVDVVVCAGLLYHTPHPLWILEGIARLKPKHVLLDTATSRGTAPEIYPEPTNLPGHRQYHSQETCGMALRLPKAVYHEAMKNLGYAPGLPIDQTPADVSQLTPEQAGIVLGWSGTLSTWYRRTRP